MKEGLFVVKVKLYARGLGYGKECNKPLSLKPTGKSVVEINLGIKRVFGSPSLSDSYT